MYVAVLNPHMLLQVELALCLVITELTGVVDTLVHRLHVLFEVKLSFGFVVASVAGIVDA